MLGKNGRDPFHLAHQGVVVGAGGSPYIDPCGVVMTQQIRVAFLKGIALLHIHMQGEPPRKEITAQGHVLLPVALDLGIGVFQLDVRVRETALHERRLRPHDGFRALSVVARDLIVMGHTLIHIGKLALQLPRRTIEHHQNGR